MLQPKDEKYHVVLTKTEEETKSGLVHATKHTHEDLTSPDRASHPPVIVFTSPVLEAELVTALRIHASIQTSITVIIL